MNKTIFLFFILSSIAFSCTNNSNQTTTAEDKEIPEQEKKLRELIKQYPDSIALWNNLIDYFASNGNYQGAIKENNKLVLKDSSNADFWDSKGRLHFLDKDTLNAVIAFERAIKISPNPKYIISLGALYAQTKNPAALVLADELFEETKGGAALQATFIKGLYYSYAGDKMKAISYFDDCLHIDYTFLDAYREKAIALYETQKYVDALKVLEVELAISKTNEEAYFWMGRCFEKLEKKEQAIQNYQLALQIDPGYIEAKDALGKLGVVQ